MRTITWQAGPMAITATRARRLRRMERTRDELARTLTPEAVLQLRAAIGLAPNPQFAVLRQSFTSTARNMLEIIQEGLRELVKRAATRVRRRTPKVLRANVCRNASRSSILRVRRLALAGTPTSAGA
ncbi:hypothetical protein ACWCYY_18190 [Kitasatospora sp. NPDC001664]